MPASEQWSWIHESAEEEFETAIRLKAKLFDAHYLYGRSAFAQGKMEKAAALFRRASDLDPADYQSLVQLAQCLRVLGRPDEERSVCEQAVRIVERHLDHYPTDARAWYLGANACLQLNDRTRSLDRSNRGWPIQAKLVWGTSCGRKPCSSSKIPLCDGLKSLGENRLCSSDSQETAANIPAQQ